MEGKGTTKGATSEEKFVHESETTEALLRLRKKLLDLSGRNVLLNYRHPRASSLRIIDELPGQIVHALMAGESFSFLPVEEPTEEQLLQYGYLGHDPETDELIELKEFPTARKWADILGFATQYELPVPNTGNQPESKHDDDDLQTIEYPTQVEARLRNIRSKAESSINETEPPPYLIVGFLEWFEHGDSERQRLAPLITMPVQITRGKLDREKGVFRYHVCRKDEGLLPNITLAEKLKNDFALDLLEYSEGETPEKYFLNLQQTIIKHKPGWRIRRYCTLGLLNFAKQTMYLDLDSGNWPTGRSLASHPTIKKFLSSWGREDDRSGSSGGVPEDYEIDSVDGIHEKAPLIFSADSSQHSAIIDVVY